MVNYKHKYDNLDSADDLVKHGVIPEDIGETINSHVIESYREELAKARKVIKNGQLLLSCYQISIMLLSKNFENMLGREDYGFFVRKFFEDIHTPDFCLIEDIPVDQREDFFKTLEEIWYVEKKDGLWVVNWDELDENSDEDYENSEDSETADEKSSQTSETTSHTSLDVHESDEKHEESDEE